MINTDLVPAEILFPSGMISWYEHRASFSPAEEYVPEIGRHACKVLFKKGAPPRDIEPGLPCVIVLEDPRTGQRRLFNSAVLFVTLKAVFIRPPRQYAVEQRKRRFRIELPGTVETREASCPVAVSDITEGLTGLGIRSAKPLDLFPGERVTVTFSHRGQQLEFSGVVVWSLRNMRFGLRGRMTRRPPA